MSEPDETLETEDVDATAEEETPELHVVFHLLPPRQLENPEAIKYKCSECQNDIFSHKTQEHAESHNATSYELDNIGEHLSLIPEEHVGNINEDTSFYS